MIATPYILLFILINSLLAFAALVKNNTIILFIVIIVLLLFSSFRYDAGIDFFSYLYLINSNWDLEFIEPISRSIMLLAREYDKAWLFFSIHSFIYISSIMYILNKLNNFSVISIYIFSFFTLSFITSFGFVRQYAAIGIMFIAFYNLYKGNRKYFFALSFLASGFHAASLTYIVLVFFRKYLFINFSPIFYLILLVTSYLLSTILLTIIINSGIDFQYIHYLTNFNFAVSGKKIYFSLLILFFIGRFMVYISNLNNYDSKLLFYSQNMFFIALLIYTLLFDYGEHLARISYYLMPFMIVWLCEISKLIKKFNNQVLYNSLILILGILYFFSTIYFASYGSRDFLNNIQFYFIDSI